MVGPQQHVSVTKYQFQIDDEKWQTWKETVPRSKSLEDRIIELIEADTDGRVLSESAETSQSLAGEPDDSEPRERTEPAPSPRDDPPEMEPNDDTTLPAEIGPEVWEAVDAKAGGWDDDARLENRRLAAATILQYAVNTGESVGKSSEIFERVREEYPVEDQSEETYWRQNIRSVLSDVGDYSRGVGEYNVDLEGSDSAPYDPTEEF